MFRAGGAVENERVVEKDEREEEGWWRAEEALVLLVL